MLHTVDMLKLVETSLLGLILLQYMTIALVLPLNAGQDQPERGNTQSLRSRQTGDTSATTVTKVGPYTVECSGEEDGTNLKVESCKDALDGIPNDHKPYALGPRGPNVDIHTPTRILSGEYHHST